MPTRTSLAGDLVQRLLDLARERTGMQLAWVSSFRSDRQVFEVLSGDPAAFGLVAGDSGLLEDSYCVRVLRGELDHVVPDAKANVVTERLEVTNELGIGSYVGVPLPVGDEQPGGMLCCVSTVANHLVGDAEVRFLELLATAIADLLAEAGDDGGPADEAKARVQQVLLDRRVDVLLQPVVHLGTGAIVGVEALSRFPEDEVQLPPDVWFRDAAHVGLSLPLELLAVEQALAHLHEVPETAYLAVNASPSLLSSPELSALLEDVPAGRVVVELTEHIAVWDYPGLHAAVDHLRELGVRLAIDDVGAGFSSFEHVLRLEPEIVKLDASLTRGADTDPARRGLARGLRSVAHDIGAVVVAEGVQTQAELDAMLALGVDAAQGFFLARPTRPPLPDPASLPTPTPRGLGGRPLGDEHDVLAYLARTWIRSNDLESPVRPLLRAVVERTQLETSYLAVKDPETGALDHRYVHATSDLEVPEGLVLPWVDTLCSRCRSADLRWTADVPTDLPGCASAEQLGVQTFLSVPVRDRDGVEWGSLCAASRERRFLGEGVVAEVELMARLVTDRI